MPQTHLPTEGQVDGSLRVMCARALTPVVNVLAADFAVRTRTNVELIFGTVGALRAKLAAGETADVLVLSQPVIEELQRSGTLAGPGSKIGSTGIGVAVRSGAPAPDISTAEAFKLALLRARAIAVSDPSVGGSAGTYLAGLFQRMGIAETLRSKSLPQPSGGDVARRVADGSAEIGMTQLSEMLPIPGIKVVGTLPPPLASDTLYCAAVPTDSDNVTLATAFIATLVSANARHLLSEAGFTPAAV